MFQEEGHVFQSPLLKEGFVLLKDLNAGEDLDKNKVVVCLLVCFPTDRIREREKGRNLYVGFGDGRVWEQQCLKGGIREPDEAESRLFLSLCSVLQTIQQEIRASGHPTSDQEIGWLA